MSAARRPRPGTAGPRRPAASGPGTPRDLGFRWPAEWEPHAATWISWPHQQEDWPGKFRPIPWVYAEFVRRLAPAERVRILVKDGETEAAARKVLRRAGADLASCDFFRIPTDRGWTRDFCPIYLKGPDGEVALTDWKFTGWAKYRNHERDDAVPAAIAESQARRAFRPVHPVPTEGAAKPSLRRVVLEGGAIDGNGCGTVLTTEECLLSTDVQCRNPGMTRADYEAVLGAWLGARSVVWLRDGIAGDDTHGHVDDLARFVGPRTVVLVREDDRTDENHARLAPNREILAAARDQDGRPFEIVDLPMPEPVVFDGQRLPASYANFYVGNAAVLVPTFNDPADREALGILADLFPGRTVVGIHCLDFVWGLGTIHCATQQEPA